MLRFSEQRLQEITGGASGRRIIVFGDLMVDEYLWGDVTRISPEAPVPIVNISQEQIRFGGAANVANNLVGLTAVPILVGVIGNDRMGGLFLDMLRQRKLPAEGIVQTDDRPTTVKTRIIGNDQHIARVDKERTDPVSPEIQQQLFERVLAVIDEVDAIIIQDYNKGVVQPNLVTRIVDLANRRGKFVTVDPKFENFLSFKNVTVFKPNVKETEEALAVRLHTEEELLNAGQRLLKELQSQAVLITRGAQGMALFEADGEVTLVSTRARKVADVSGAGDTVIATLTYALCGGASVKEAVYLSNFAAGLVCEEVGVVPVERDRLVKSVLRNQNDYDD